MDHLLYLEDKRHQTNHEQAGPKGPIRGAAQTTEGWRSLITPRSMCPCLGDNCRMKDSMHVSQKNSVVYRCEVHNLEVGLLDLRAGLLSGGIGLSR